MLDLDAAGACLLLAEGERCRRLDLEGRALEPARGWSGLGLTPRLVGGGQLLRICSDAATGELLGLKLDALGPADPLFVRHLGPPGVPRRLVVSAEGNLALLLLRPDLAQLFDLHRGSSGRLLWLDQSPHGLALSESQRLLAVGGQAAIRLLELDGSHRLVKQLETTGPATWIGMAGGWLSFRDHQGLGLCSLDGGPGRLRLPWQGRGPLVLSPEGRYLAAADLEEVHLWDLQLAERRLLTQAATPVRLLRFLIGGRLLAIGDSAGSVSLHPLGRA